MGEGRGFDFLVTCWSYGLGLGGELSAFDSAEVSLKMSGLDPKEKTPGAGV